MCFLLAGARDKFVYLDMGLGVILVFIGAKFMLTEFVSIGAITESSGLPMTVFDRL